MEKLPEYKSQMDIIVNGARVTLPKYPVVNGELITGSYEIQEGDAVEFLDYATVEQIKTFMDIPDHPGNVGLVNNKEAAADTRVYENFEVIWKLVNRPQQSISPVGATTSMAPKMAMVAPVIEEDYLSDYEQGEEVEGAVVENETVAVSEPAQQTEETVAQITPVQPAASIEAPKAEAATETNAVETKNDNTEETESSEAAPEVPAEPRNVYVVVNGKSVTMTGKPKYVFVDVFNFIEFDLSKPQGAIVTQVNGHDANYMEELQNGDVIQIYWRKI